VDGDETRYLIDANRSFAQVVEEYSPGGAVRATYTHGPHQLISQSRTAPAPGITRWLGQHTRVNGQDRQPDRQLRFDTYGRTLVQSGPDGQRVPSTPAAARPEPWFGYLRARYLNINAEVFLGEDPIRAQAKHL